MLRFRKWLPFLMLAAFLLIYLPPQLAAQTENRAAIVVNMGDGNVQKRCVTFSEPQITGYDLLLRSGLDVVVDVQSVGSLVCRIDGVGCPADDCLCQCKGGGDCVYWSYWHQLDGRWQYSQAGAHVYPITNGAVDGWSWGLGAVNQASPPPSTAFEEVCQAPATFTPNATAVPPTATPQPTQTPTRSPEIEFSVEAGTISSGSCTKLHWRTTHILAVYLNGSGVVGEETREICPDQTETYDLKVVHAGGEETRSLTVTVLAAQETLTPTSVIPVTPATAGAARPATAVPAIESSSVEAAVSPTATEWVVTSPVSTAPAADTLAAATATEEIAWFTVPPRDTATVEPAAVIAAVFSPTPQSEATPAPAVVENEAAATDATAVSWVSYAGFLAIISVLGFLILRTQKQTVSS